MMKTIKETLEMALEALEYIHEGANNQGTHTGISWRCVSNKAEPVITDLLKALAQERSSDEQPAPVQEKVTACYKHGDEPKRGCAWCDKQPAQRTWIELTDDEIDLFINGRGDEDDEDYVEPTGDGFGLTDADLVQLVRKSAAKLKAKNSL